MESAACRRRASDTEQSARWTYSATAECEPVVVKEEPEWGECGVSEAAAAEGLYAGHEVKDEVVIGPETVQQQDVAFSMQNAACRLEGPCSLKPKGGANNAPDCTHACPGEGPRCNRSLEQQYGRRSCLVRLERLLVGDLHRGKPCSSMPANPSASALRRSREQGQRRPCNLPTPLACHKQDCTESDKDVSLNRRRRILDVSTSSDDEELERRDESPVLQEPAVTTDALLEHTASASAPEASVDKPTPCATTVLPSDGAPENTEPELDAEFSEILGIDPTQANNFGKDIQKDLAVRLEHCATSGLSKESRKELRDKYLIPANCKGIDAPSLNLEIKAALSDTTLKRDKAIESRQKLIAAAISALGEAFNLLLSFKERNPTLMRILMDAGRLLCDSQHNDSLTRRQFILTATKKEMREQLEKTKIDSLLFGQNFSETLKNARAINKSGAELKAPAPPKTAASRAPKNWKNLPGTSKNWKNSNLARKQTAPKTKEKTFAPTKTTRSNSSKQSLSRRNEYSRR